MQAVTSTANTKRSSLRDPWCTPRESGYALLVPLAYTKNASLNRPPQRVGHCACAALPRCGESGSRYAAVFPSPRLRSGARLVQAVTSTANTKRLSLRALGVRQGSRATPSWFPWRTPRAHRSDDPLRQTLPERRVVAATQLSFSPLAYARGRA